MATTYERIVKEDLNLGVGQVPVTMPAGGTALGSQLGTHTWFPGCTNVIDYGAVADGLTNDTDAIQDAINAVSTNGGTVFLPPGTYLHDGVTIAAPNVNLRGMGVGTKLKRSANGSSPNITIASNSNYSQIHDLMLLGSLASTHGIHLIDSVWCKFVNVSVKGWGTNSSGMHLETRTFPAHGAYFTEIIAPDIDASAYDGPAIQPHGGNIPNSTGIYLLGDHAVAGANRNRIYGGSVRNCAYGIRTGYSNSLLVVGSECSGCLLGYQADDAFSTYHLFLRHTFEANIAHLNIGVLAADHVFLFPTFSEPLLPGTDQGARTQIIATDGALDSSAIINTVGMSQVRSQDATMLMRLYGVNAGWTNHAGGSGATLGNSPVAGNPTKWIAIDDNGVTRYLPAW